MADTDRLTAIRDEIGWSDPATWTDMVFQLRHKFANERINEINRQIQLLARERGGYEKQLEVMRPEWDRRWQEKHG